MKKRLLFLITIVVIMAVMTTSSFFVSAVDATVSMDFEGGSDKFVPSGDLNADGKVAAEDLASFRRLILEKFNTNIYEDLYANFGEEAKYTDANGDGYVDARDLVRTKKNATKIFIDSTAGVDSSSGMNILGKTSYSESLKTVLNADSYYKISYSYKADEPLTVVIDGIGNQDYEFECGVSDKWITETHLFATTEKYNSDNGIELLINGSGVIDNITITPCNIDNDLPDTW